MFSKNSFEFKRNFTFQERKMESNRVISKYEDRLPVICERNKKSNLINIDKNKYLVPKDLTIGQFIYIIRKRMNLPEEKAIFLMVNGIIPQQNENMFNIYYKYKDDDDFLYLSYTSENVFG